MNTRKTLGLAAIAILTIGLGATAIAMRNNEKMATDHSSKPTSDAAQSATITAVKSETEKKFEALVGEEYDRLFLSNMLAHHQGAIDMAKLAQANAKHSELKGLAGDIIAAQTSESNDMVAWQKNWGYPASSGEAMVDHGGMDMTFEMEEMNKGLAGKTGDDFDKAFLSSMIMHHESAIAMARPGIKNAFHPEIKTLAQAIIDAQTGEIAKMRQWQTQWGYEG